MQKLEKDVYLEYIPDITKLLRKMKSYEINGTTIELDPNKVYFDYFVEDKKQNLVEIKLEKMLEKMQLGKIKIDENLQNYFVYLKRWETEAPRKRNLRQMRLEGIVVLTSDNLFEGTRGLEIIKGLENTGIFAEYFLKKMYGE